jgi:hypothetical protein
MELVKAPHEYPTDKPLIFLAGSIEQGKATDWQSEIADVLKDNDVTILNPRRDEWDDSWEQSITNPQFKEQVEWELDGQDASDLIVMYYDPDTKSPITLMELGLFKDKNMIVCCPNGFWRRGNIEVVCDRYNIPLVDDIEEFKHIIGNLVANTRD